MTPIMPNAVNSHKANQVQLTPLWDFLLELRYLQKANIFVICTIQQVLTPNTWNPRGKMCAESDIYGVGVCVESQFRREYYHEEYPLYYFLGETYMGVKVDRGMQVQQYCAHHKLTMVSRIQHIFNRKLETQYSVKVVTLMPNLQRLLLHSLLPASVKAFYQYANTYRQTAKYSSSSSRTTQQRWLFVFAS